MDGEWAASRGRPRDGGAEGHPAAHQLDEQGAPGTVEDRREVPSESSGQRRTGAGTSTQVIDNNIDFELYLNNLRRIQTFIHHFHHPEETRLWLLMIIIL